ncbi:uncharacterized protein [Oryza sativa Japonica Group]|uniref:uncharacterized protein n=1 Tax=Oryza sativa subsp. japonica TaxID=39947 RepID=UPI00339CB760
MGRRERLPVRESTLDPRNQSGRAPSCSPRHHLLACRRDDAITAAQRPISGNADLATGALERGYTVVNAQPRVRAAVPVASRRIRLSCCSTSFASPSSPNAPRIPQNRAARREIDHRLLQLRSSASVVDSHSTDSENSEFVERDSEVECVSTQQQAADDSGGVLSLDNPVLSIVVLK